MGHDDEEAPVVSHGEMIWRTIASFGWYVVGTAFLLLYASPYIREKYASWKEKRDERDYASKYHKNTDLGKERSSALEVSRRRMQEEYQRRSIIALEREDELREKKREASRSADHAVVGYRLGDGQGEASDSSKSLKSKPISRDYNPLMGDNTRRYRPQKRSCCGSGGCG